MEESAAKRRIVGLKIPRHQGGAAAGEHLARFLRNTAAFADLLP
jgi:hypothetical protein